MTKESKTQQALALMREEGITAYAAAKRIGITTTTVQSAWRKAQGICPCCSQKIGVAVAVERVIAALDRTAAQSESPEKRAVCEDVARLLRDALK